MLDAPSPTSAQATITAAVRFLLTLREQPQVALVEVLGVSRTGVSQRLTGQTRWTSEDLDALSTHFDVPLVTLVTPPPGRLTATPP